MQNVLPAGLKCLTIEDFEPCVGEDFEVDSKPIVVSLRLERLTRHSNGPGFLTRAPFGLIWSTDPSIDMLGGLYSLRIPLHRNGAWGPYPVYVEPMLGMGARRMYQSVFF